MPIFVREFKSLTRKGVKMKQFTHGLIISDHYVKVAGSALLVFLILFDSSLLSCKLPHFLSVLFSEIFI